MTASPLRWVALALAALLTALVALAILTPLSALTSFYLLHQDAYVLAALIGLLVAAGLPSSSTGRVALPQVRLTGRRVAACAMLGAILLWAGTYLLLDNYALTRDEHMVLFDMAVFRSGRLAAPLPAEWRPYADALAPAFRLPLAGNIAWVSAYMPGNAMLRTAFGMVADPALMNPLLAGVGAIALFDIARRGFPDNRGAQAIALLLYATSAQVLVAAMTPYAMTAHLALNLGWLSFYLRGSRRGHAGAIALGFLGIGLHQVVFHPLFAAPFIERLRRTGQWRTAAVYAICYAAFFLFWISYPHLVALSAGAAGGSGAGAGSGGFISTRILPLLVDRDPATLQLTAANLIRFVAWQNLALLPLLALSAAAIRRNEGIARPLAWGVLATVVAMAVLLPYQGHGWGYRYLHGLIGSCALLAAYAWSDFSERQEVRAFARIATLVTLFGSLPFLLWQAHVFVNPYARLNAQIARANAAVVVVDTDFPGFVVDEVRNGPDLSNRPIRVSSASLSSADMRVLCRHGAIAFVGVDQFQSAALATVSASDSVHFNELLSAAAGCSGTAA